MALVRMPVNGLTPGMSYHYRLVSSNNFGTTKGADAVLVTGTKIAAWMGEGQNYVTHPNILPGLTNIVALACGHNHTLAITTEGTVRAWGVGLSKYGYQPSSTNVPSGQSNVVAVAGGFSHSLALKADGTVLPWGYNIGSLSPPASLTNVTAISAETWHSLARCSDGTVVAWGDSSYGKTTVPAGLTNVVAVSAAFKSSLALKADGTLVAWGEDAYVTNVPVALSNVFWICSGDYFSVVMSPINLPPVAYPVSYTGGIDKQLRLSLWAWDPNGDPVTLRVASLPRDGTLYQCSGGVAAEAITSTDTPLTDPSHVVFQPAPEQWAAPYASFSFVANDGEADSVPGIATVNIIPRPIIQSAGLVFGSNPGFALSWPGLPQQSYSVWYSTNLTNWKIVGYATELSPGLYSLVDSSATNQTSRFYRVLSP